MRIFLTLHSAAVVLSALWLGVEVARVTDAVQERCVLGAVLHGALAAWAAGALAFNAIYVSLWTKELRRE